MFPVLYFTTRATISDVCCCNPAEERSWSFTQPLCCTVILNNSPRRLWAEEWSTAWPVLGRVHRAHLVCLVHSQYGGSSISMIDKHFRMRPQLSIRGGCLTRMYAFMRAAHFLFCGLLFLPSLQMRVILLDQSLSINGPTSSVQRSSIQCFKISGRWFISLIHSFVQSTARRGRWVCPVVGWRTHILLGRGTSVNSCSWSGGSSEQGRRSCWCYSVCVCVCLLNSQEAIWTLLHLFIFLRKRWTRHKHFFFVTNFSSRSFRSS